jgi:hypothetical protein
MSTPLAVQIESLQQRRQALEKERVQLQTRKDLAVDKLNEIAAQAKEKFGVDSLEDLRELHRKWTTENEANLAQFEQDVRRLESELLAVKQSMQAANG